MAHCTCRVSNVLAGMILAAAPAAVLAQEQEVVGSWRVEYRTRALKVVAVEESPAEGNARLITVKLKNISGRPITAIALNVEQARSRMDMGWTGIPLKPGDATDFSATHVGRVDVYRSLRINAVLFADNGPDDGDRPAIHVLRFGRLGGLLEENRCVGMLNGLDPSTLHEASVNQSLASVAESPKTIDEALASLPEDPQLKVGSHERIRAASADAQEAFLTGVHAHRRGCNEDVRRLAQELSARPSAERARTIEALRRHHQTTRDKVLPFSKRDMDREVEP